MIVDSTGNHYKTMYKKDYVADVTIRSFIRRSRRDVGYSSCNLIMHIQFK